MTDPDGGRIVIASDHAGFALKTHLAEYLRGRGLAVDDLGPDDEGSCDYPDFAHRVAERVVAGREGAERVVGVLVCGTGIGMSMAANRHRGVRAALCAEPYSARMSRQHNDANILCLAARVLGVGLAEAIVDAFLDASFEGGRHTRRVAKIER